MTNTRTDYRTRMTGFLLKQPLEVLACKVFLEERQILSACNYTDVIGKAAEDRVIAEEYFGAEVVTQTLNLYQRFAAAGEARQRSILGKREARKRRKAAAEQ